MTSDVVIAGAGPAGLATAIALRNHGLSVCVLEREPNVRPRIGESVPGEIRRALHALGVWDAFAASGHLRSAGKASAWGTAELSRWDAFSAPLGGGWHIDRARFEELLQYRACEAGARIWRGRHVTGVQAVGDGEWLVDATGRLGLPESVRGRVLVDATGRQAAIARRLGAERQVHDRLICAYHTFGVHGATALEGRTVLEAVEHGWWYAAPLPGQRAIAALFTAPRPFRRENYRYPARWHQAWQSTTHLSSMLACPRPARRLDVIAVTAHCLDRTEGERWIAVGDAAVSTDPLASAGITFALRDGVQTGAAIAALHTGEREALIDRTTVIHRRFVQYVIERAAYYRLERRWPDSEFWRERQRPTATLAGATT